MGEDRHKDLNRNRHGKHTRASLRHFKQGTVAGATAGSRIGLCCRLADITVIVMIMMVMGQAALMQQFR
jgi:hypothetical protein